MSSVGSGPTRKSLAVDTDQDGWLVSYADLITLLFVLFAVLLSVSKVSKSKLELLSQKVNQAQATTLSQFKENLNQEIQKEGLHKEVSVQISDEGLEILFKETVLFAVGEASLSPRGQTIINAFSKLLKLAPEKGFSLAVDGHTDSTPIKTNRFGSNWSLSYERAVNVLHQLESGGLNPKKMMIRAFADTKPVSETDFSQNRRVSLLVF